jgi:hypothetical protein
VRRLDLEALERRSIADLEEMAVAIPAIIQRKRRAPDEDDIAREFSGDLELLAESLEEDEQSPGYRRVLWTVYCSAERCPRCPHGPYWFTIRTNKRLRTRAIRYSGRPAFDWHTVQALRAYVRPPIAVADSVDELIRLVEGESSHE